MRFLVGFFNFYWLRAFDFIPPLAIRLLMAPIFWVSGSQRLGLFTTDQVVWFNPLTWVNFEVVKASSAQFSNEIISGLGAETLTLGIGTIEVLGAVLLIFGFAVRWIVPFLIAVVLYLGYLNLAGQPLAEQFQKFVMEHGFITMEHSQFEVYITYLILLLTLFFMGAGRWFSLDWMVYRRFTRGMRQQKSARIANTDPFEIDATDEPRAYR